MPDLEGKNWLFSIGPMRTALDPVRYIQNRSSGRMGFALAQAAAERGAIPTILLGPVDTHFAARFDHWDVVRYESPAEYGTALQRLFPQCEVFFSLAAVLDFEVIALPQKIPRESLGESLTLPLRKVPDFAAWAGAHKKAGQTVIAFAAESGNASQIQARAESKRLKKNADAIVANPVSEGLGPDSDKNEIWLLRPGQQTVHWGPEEKSTLAPLLLETLFPRTA